MTGASKPLRFPTTGFDLVPSSEKLEEERFDNFATGNYYPVFIGEVFRSRYQVVGKLGFGSTSTVWLARDLLYAETLVLDMIFYSVQQ